VTHNRAALRQSLVYAWLILAGALIAVFAMQRALQVRDYSLAYVQEVGSSTTPTLYNVAAMWSALEGSILLWVLVLAASPRGRVAVPQADRRPLVGWALVVMFVVWRSSRSGRSGRPTRSPPAPPVPFGFDGPGPNPLLQNHILVAFHPPMLYLGYVGFTVPFAFAIAALVTGRVGEGWLLETRRWTLFAWGFLTVGIMLGAWWSYEVLGWGGYWAWDPVENASLLPWLTGTAYIHSVMVQERRGMLRVWNLSRCSCATFASRSSARSSPARASSTASTPSRGRRSAAYLLGFFAVIVVVSLGSSAGAATGCGRPGASTRRCRARARSSPTTCCSPPSRSWCCSARCSRCSSRRSTTAASRSGPVLRPDDDADRPAAAVPDGRRPGAAVAQGVPGAAARAAVLAGVVRRGRARVAVLVGADGLGAAARVRARRVRRRRGRSASSCSPPAARAGGASSAGPTAAWSCTSA
jgi:hypothetical protein